jgi:hypothetical protein
VCHSTLHNFNDGWHICGVEINYENDIPCCHCGSDIERAYE